MGEGDPFGEELLDRRALLTAGGVEGVLFPDDRGVDGWSRLNLFSFLS